MRLGKRTRVNWPFPCIGSGAAGSGWNQTLPALGGESLLLPSFPPTLIVDTGHLSASTTSLQYSQPSQQITERSMLLAKNVALARPVAAPAPSRRPRLVVMRSSGPHPSLKVRLLPMC